MVFARDKKDYNSKYKFARRISSYFTRYIDLVTNAYLIMSTMASQKHHDAPVCWTTSSGSQQIMFQSSTLLLASCEKPVISSCIPLMINNAEGISMQYRLHLKFRFSLQVDIVSSCDDDYYGNQCELHCDTKLPDQHYRCNRLTGEKICDEGYLIDEI